MKILDKVCQDCFMISSNKNITWEKYIWGYIYYKRIYTNEWLINNLQDIIEKLQLATQSWEHLLFSSDGKLETTKCGIYKI